MLDADEALFGSGTERDRYRSLLAELRPRRPLFAGQRVLDFGASPELLYLVTEIAEGRKLRDELKGEPLMADRAVHLLRQIAEGLSAIHEKGLVHRDLRPENVFVQSTPRGEVVRLVDFGIARLVDPDGGEARVTVALRAVGLPQYMSPEQGRGAPTDSKSDLYSLGVLAFELLAGRLPFDGPRHTDYALQHQEKPPRPLATAAPHLADHVRLCELVMRCLEKDPAKRPASALQVAEALAHVPQVGEPTILVEALQKLPPALPLASSKPKPAAPPATPAIEAPRSPELMPSIPMPAVSDADVAPPPGAPAPVPTPAAPLKRKLVAAALGGAAALAVVLALLVWSMDSVAEDARELLEDGKAVEALSLVEKAMRDAHGQSEPELLMLQAVAFHRLDRHREETAIIRDQGPTNFIAKARPRPLSEILDMADLYYRLHWAAIDLRLKGNRSPAVDEEIVQERHRALNWLIRYMNQEWDDVQTDT